MKKSFWTGFLFVCFFIVASGSAVRAQDKNPVFDCAGFMAEFSNRVQIGTMNSSEIKKINALAKDGFHPPENSFLKMFWEKTTWPGLYLVLSKLEEVLKGEFFDLETFISWAETSDATTLANDLRQLHERVAKMELTLEGTDILDPSKRGARDKVTRYEAKVNELEEQLDQFGAEALSADHQIVKAQVKTLQGEIETLDRAIRDLSKPASSSPKTIKSDKTLPLVEPVAPLDEQKSRRLAELNANKNDLQARFDAAKARLKFFDDEKEVQKKAQEAALKEKQGKLTAARAALAELEQKMTSGSAQLKTYISLFAFESLLMKWGVWQAYQTEKKKREDLAEVQRANQARIDAAQQAEADKKKAAAEYLKKAAELAAAAEADKIAKRDGSKPKAAGETTTTLDESQIGKRKP
jgi:DNA repair exonuclease SbcCD ATPase subunit